MELVHDFTVPVGVDRAWEIFTDIEQVVTCMPGASVSSVSGDAFEGGMTVKVGPIGMTFAGEGAFVEKDPDTKRAVIRAGGRDAKGNAGAQALVTASLAGRPGATDVHVVTDLNVSGRAAQFGTSVMKDVSNRLLDQFVENLGSRLASSAGPTLSPAPGAVAASSRATSGSGPAFPSSDSGSLDVAALFFGNEAVKSSARTVLTLVVGCAFGYLWGTNKSLKRQVRGD
jgi:carbon monoxide dehydrogenase subunit G